MHHGTVMLSAAKHLDAQRDRPFASLRVTIEPCHAERSEASRRPVQCNRPLAEFTLSEANGLRVTVEGPISSSVVFC